MSNATFERFPINTVADNLFLIIGLHALGKPVVLIAENLVDVPFDLQPLRVIIYDKNDPKWGAELKGNITASLQETLAEPVSAVPAMFRKVVKSQAPPESQADVRLDILERQVSALAARRESSFGSGAIRSPNDLRQHLLRAHSHSHAVDIVKRAVAGGLSPRLIASVVHRAIVNRSERNAVLSDVGIEPIGRSTG